MDTVLSLKQTKEVLVESNRISMKEMNSLLRTKTCMQSNFSKI